MTMLYNIKFLWIISLVRGCALAVGQQQQSKPPQNKIKHVVVLMQENRSFDHMLGWYQRIDPRVEGLVNPKHISDELLVYNNHDRDQTKRKICLPMDPKLSPKNTQETFACVNDEATNDECSDDPCHQYDCTARQIYGMNESNVHADNLPPPRMNGFLWDAQLLRQDPINRISMQKPRNVPIMVQLAREFCLFDRFFASHPGPTYPNRQFVHTGTASGELNCEVPREGFSQKTIYEKLLEHGHEWRVYYDGKQGMSWIQFLSYFNSTEAVSRSRTMEEFYGDAARGTLPSYSFVEPRIFRDPSDAGPSRGLPNHQHPVSSVKEGERLYKNIYEALRNGPAWNHTLFILTYDEHGGFFDHVPPPQNGVPSPDATAAANGFDYTRLGIRLPFLLVSPWIRRGTLVQEPNDNQKPFGTSQWDLTSIPATVHKLFGLEDSLTRRDAWAATFEDVVLDNGLDEPRQDCPTKLSEIAPSTEADVQRFERVPLDDHQKQLIEHLCLRNGHDGSCGDHLVGQNEASEFSAALWESYAISKLGDMPAAPVVASPENKAFDVTAQQKRELRE